MLSKERWIIVNGLRIKKDSIVMYFPAESKENAIYIVVAHNGVMVDYLFEEVKIKNIDNQL